MGIDKICGKKYEKKQQKRNRRWTEDELELFALVLTDDENNFV